MNEQRDQAIINAVWGDGPAPAPVASAGEILDDWIESTQESINALRAWLRELKRWRDLGGESKAGDFMAAYRRMAGIMGDGWADQNPAGGGIDRLADAVRGE